MSTPDIVGTINQIDVHSQARTASTPQTGVGGPAWSKWVSRQTGRKAAEWAVRLGMFLALAIVWQWWAGRSQSLVLASFTETIGGLQELVTTGELWSALWESNKAVLIAYPIAVVTAVPFGLMMARLPWLGRASSPMLVLMLAIPMAPLVPVFIIAFGLGVLPRVIIILLFSWVFIAMNARSGAKTVDANLVQMARSYGCNEREIWVKILWPASLPAIMAGLRIGAARAIEGMVVAELLMVASGVGGLLLRYRGQFQSDLVFAMVVVIVIEALLVVGIMRTIEQRTVRWAVED